MEVEKLSDIELAILVYSLETFAGSSRGDFRQEVWDKLNSLSEILNKEYKKRNLNWRMFE